MSADREVGADVAGAGRGDSPARRVGALGTLVWDRIHYRDAGRSEPVEEWGGLGYALAAFEAACPSGWELFPILKVGTDLREEAGELLGELRTIRSLEGVRPVSPPNNRVDLFYRGMVRSCERLRGGVPGWTAEELVPLARSCDALYVNFISGWEMGLEDARRLRLSFDGPIYCDLHSLLLGVGSDGVRRPRPLSEWREWLRCFDVVQLNEAELETLASRWGDPWALAADAVGEETRALLITLGERGAAWVAAPDFEGLRADAPVRTELVRRRGPARTGKVAAPHVVPDGDPTGCGDVWGMTCFCEMLRGRPIVEAMARANEAAARNAGHRGASGLSRFLRGEASVIREEVP